MKYERIQAENVYRASESFYSICGAYGKSGNGPSKEYRQMCGIVAAGVRIYVQESENAERKTKWDLIGVEKESRIVNMDSQIPNKVVKGMAGRRDFV